MVFEMTTTGSNPASQQFNLTIIGDIKEYKFNLILSSSEHNIKILFIILYLRGVYVSNYK